MRIFRIFLFIGSGFFMGLGVVSAEELKTFCSQTCGLWPKLCSSATVCMALCDTPHRLMKACRSNKVPVDTQLPEIPYTKQQFCRHVCTQETLRCAAATYCIQACRMDSKVMSQCLVAGKAVDTQRPQLRS